MGSHRVGKPQPHDSTLGESSREAQSGRRLLGTNGGSLWLWCCLAQPGAPNLPLGLRGKAGGGARVTAGPMKKLALKLNIQKMKIMASGPTTSWEIDGETVETVSDFIFLGSTGASFLVQDLPQGPAWRAGPRHAHGDLTSLAPHESATVSTVSPSISHEVVGPDAMIFIF